MHKKFTKNGTKMFILCTVLEAAGYILHKSMVDFKCPLCIIYTYPSSFIELDPHYLREISRMERLSIGTPLLRF